MIGTLECRKYAEECLRRGRATKDSKLKAALLSMARTWTALAVQTERIQDMLRAGADREATGGEAPDEDCGAVGAAMDQDAGNPPKNFQRD